MQARSRVPLALFALVSAVATASCAEAQDEMRPEVALVAVADSCAALPAMGRLCGCVYDLPVETRRLPDFAGLRPLEMLCTDRLAVSLRKGPPGFPGVSSRFEWFGVDFKGTIMVAKPGPMSFRLASDDGAQLYVDEQRVLNNDGLHDVRVVEGTVALDAGPHRVRIPYWNGPGPMALTLEVARPGEPYEVLRMDAAL